MDSEALATPIPKPVTKEKTEEQVQREIQDIMRNICSSVTFLPSIAEKCTFYLLSSFLSFLPFPACLRKLSAFPPSYLPSFPSLLPFFPPS